MYKELKGIDFVIYFNNTIKRYCKADLRNKEAKDDNGNLWYEGCFGNCLIHLKYQRNTDKLYLFSDEAIKRLDAYLTKNSKWYLKVENNPLKEILDKMATKTITRK